MTAGTAWKPGLTHIGTKTQLRIGFSRTGARLNMVKEVRNDTSFSCTPFDIWMRNVVQVCSSYSEVAGPLRRGLMGNQLHLSNLLRTHIDASISAKIHMSFHAHGEKYVLQVNCPGPQDQNYYLDGSASPS